MGEMTLTDFDTCECGDYRRSHKGGVGSCAFNLPSGLGHHGARNCDEFRLSRKATELPEFYRKAGALSKQEAGES